MFKKLFSEFRIPLRYHLLFWLIYFVFNFFRFATINNDYWYSLKSNLIEFPLNIIITYFTIYYLIPKFILKKKYLQFFLLPFLVLHPPPFICRLLRKKYFHLPSGTSFLKLKSRTYQRLNSLAIRLSILERLCTSPP